MSPPPPTSPRARPGAIHEHLRRQTRWTRPFLAAVSGPIPALGVAVIAGRGGPTARPSGGTRF